MNSRQNLIDTFMERNSKLNLSAIRDEEGIYTKHILDSIEVMKFFVFEHGKSVIDLGTGGGFPLLPLAISNPKVNFVGIDARQKKITAINDMINRLKIQNAKAIWGRGEEHGVQYDYLVTRAVGYIDKLMDFGYDLVKTKGFFIFYKQYSDEEQADIKKTCKKLKLTIKKVHRYKLFEGDIERIIYIIQKH